MVQLVQKAVKRELEWSILTLIFVFVGLCCLFRILEIAIDPKNFLNILSPGARLGVFWLVIFCLLIEFFAEENRSKILFAL